MVVDNLGHRPAHQEEGLLSYRPAHRPLDHRPAHQQEEEEEDQEETGGMTTFEKFNAELNSS